MDLFILLFFVCHKSRAYCYSYTFKVLSCCWCLLCVQGREILMEMFVHLLASFFDLLLLEQFLYQHHNMLLLMKLWMKLLKMSQRQSTPMVMNTTIPTMFRCLQEAQILPHSFWLLGLRANKVQFITRDNSVPTISVRDYKVLGSCLLYKGRTKNISYKATPFDEAEIMRPICILPVGHPFYLNGDPGLSILDPF